MPVRVLVVTNFMPDASAPQRGRWVRDQVDEVRRRGVEVDLFEFARGRDEYLPATRRLRSLLRRERFDLVHAHYGLAGWVARLAGREAAGRHLPRHRRPPPPRRPPLAAAGLAARPRRRRLAGAVRARGRAAGTARGPGLGGAPLRSRPAALRGDPAGARRGASSASTPTAAYLFFPANPARPEKRHDRAAEVAAACGADLLTGGSIEPERMPLWINAANAVLVTSDYEGFGMAAVEALACEVPVLSTDVGIAPYALGGIDGCLCAPFDADAWAAVARRHLEAPDPRVAGAARAATLSAAAMAERVIEAYRAVLEGVVPTQPRSGNRLRRDER